MYTAEIALVVFLTPCKASELFWLLCICVHSDDLTGQVLAYTSLLPIAILVGFVTLIVFKRELHTVSHMTSQRMHVAVVFIKWLLCILQCLSAFCHVHYHVFCSLSDLLFWGFGNERGAKLAAKTHCTGAAAMRGWVISTCYLRKHF